MAISTSMQNKICILRMLRYVFPYGWTNDVNLEMVLTGEVESRFCESGSKALTAQFLRDFSMSKLQDISAHAVFKIGDFSVALDFEAASRDFLQFWRLMTKDFPHGHWMQSGRAWLLGGRPYKHTLICIGFEEHEHHYARNRNVEPNWKCYPRNAAVHGEASG